MQRVFQILAVILIVVAAFFVWSGNTDGVFIAAGTRLHRFVNGTFQPVEGIATAGDGRIEHLLGGHDGSLWLGFHNAVIKRWKDGALTT